MLAPDVAAALAFGTSPDGTVVGPDDFATTSTASFTIDVPAGGNATEVQAEAELGKDRNAVVRLMISDRAEGSSRDANQRVLLGDPASAGYAAFRAGMAEYVALLPPNSHGEANPADKDPVPPPFDNTYNSPEHDAFVLKVKYQRSDKFFTDNMVDGADRARLNEAWNDLFGSWPYHDAYLGMLVDHYGLKLTSRRIQDLDAAGIAAVAAEARPHLRSLRAHYDDVVRAQTLAEPGHLEHALTFASRAWRRPLTAAEKSGLRAFYEKSRTVNQLDHDAALRALLARVLVSPAFLYRVETAGPGPERSLNGWELASRMSFFLWSSIPDDELRRAAAAGELANPAMLAKQVKRMTADPRARRLATEFFGQWLGFYHFDQYRGVDTGRFPEFTDEVKSSMYDEAISTFEFIVRQERPVKELLFADYTFLNKPLAKFYGIEKDVTSTDKVERVEGANAFDRGGALRLGIGADDDLGAAAHESGQARRLGPAAHSRDADAAAGRPTPARSRPTIRRSAGRRCGNGSSSTSATRPARRATCGSTRWASRSKSSTRSAGLARDYADGKAVDVTGELMDKTTIVGAQGLLKYLQSQDRQVMTTLSKKMLGYALGRLS